MAYIAIIETAIYLLLIIYGAKTSEYSNNYNSSYLTATLTQLQTVKPWHIIATIGAVLGYALRKWSFITLNEFFTFQLTIRPGHKLITHGPYKYLRHPSYTGGIINGICFCLLIFHKGLWSVMFAFILDQIKSSWLNTTTFGTRILYLSSSLLRGEWLVTLITIVMVRAILERIANEEKMMKNHFGKEWYTYANKRWSLVPFVY
ncbi:Isoprenylcysteine carboxyl methyltransferase family-domain-containing protein [Lobosporangium transversale]|uniref:Protein-S-isoprenylcysteine O-methyltransferase n=1 Tax=Lobosporangium transversale TaxID=64571 RepID=A0A1Y2H4S0_9FUNG|nr:Isoprenylcysteine carboxyl methyltransferase family-domain-containing protein [Lobosporangium transversale]ORZ28032.1 Isoprenylcysteine carboxyl methyltransferase family-domain-containing protein [Lobosporangium transversale]|eukprot:XP_021885735.1 Isoprenylcysteine carboxyl methyltransferase family-domain-containing protein [Lobosporangium transversale]